ncbi:MAG: hypothetical protein IPN96_15940 [Anaerolineales bacterium]|nr:hypothetical protein [Anaerolineales bacterium]
MYRTLEFLVENGLVRSAHMGNGHLVYRDRAGMNIII